MAVRIVLGGARQHLHELRGELSDALVSRGNSRDLIKEERKRHAVAILSVREKVE
jgi:hypothetical protein